MKGKVGTIIANEYVSIAGGLISRAQPKQGRKHMDLVMERDQFIVARWRTA